MHGYSSGYAVRVNAEVHSMGGVVDSGGGIGVDTSPRRAAIEKAQAELRQEYDVREIKRRELEFLEKGGNPLDFKLGITASHSVHSNSLADQQAEHFGNSEAKGSFARTTSPHGDSVESSGRPGAPMVSEPNTADNLLLFDGENELLEGGRSSRHLNKRNKFVQSERSSHMKPNENAKETEDSAIFRPYARRNRSRINRDLARSNSTDLSQNRGGHGNSLSLRGGSKDVKGSISETPSQKDRHTASVSLANTATANTNGTMILKSISANIQSDPELNHAAAARETSAATKAYPSKNHADVSDVKGCVTMAGIESDPACSRLSASKEFPSPEAALKTGHADSSSELNGMEYSKVDKEGTENNRDSNIGINLINEKHLQGLDKVESSGNPMQKILKGGGIQKLTDSKNDIKDFNDENQGQGTPGLQDKVKLSSDTEKLPQNESSELKSDGKAAGVLTNEPQTSANVNVLKVTKNIFSGTDDTSSKPHVLEGGLTLTNTGMEDSILEEARIIQAKRKRIAELSSCAVPLEMPQKSHWAFVLEEMTWLANDFAQERLWKITAASQVSRQIAFRSGLRSVERFQHGKLKKVAFTIAKAVLQFWHSVEMLGQSDVRINMVDGNGATEDKKINIELNSGTPRQSTKLGIQDYAQRFLKHNSSSVPCPRAAAPSTPDIISDSVIMETSWNDHLTEESLFYLIPSGAMEVYRKSVELHLVQCEPGSSTQEEVETSLYDAAAEFGYNDIAYDEEEGETNSYYLSGAFDCKKSSKLNYRKRKNLTKSYSARSYELGADVPYGNEIIGSSLSAVAEKRPRTNFSVGSVPTKRMRTASRQRIISPFCSGTAGSLPMPAKSDASSGDTSSFQDEPSSLRGGSAVHKGTEVESGDFDKQVPYDCAETSVKRRKKKARLGPAYDQSWHPDSIIHSEQRDHWKRRLESQHHDSNGSYGQHTLKKQKTLDTNYDGVTPISGSLPSPAASQMSNMSNPNKFIKLIGGRDRGRKAKGLKNSPGQQGSGNPWSLLEDQALVVLVHDMGPNWDLISDAINSILKIKCIYRNPTECKERHKNVMDRGPADGADSADDSGTSQSYPSTLPGIPKGSARQLFQRLQGPMEEDTLKSHFEKIILIGKKLHHRKPQHDIRDPKQIVSVHNSQIMALSQVFPNNLNGGVLTPLDLCDAITSGQDVLSLETPASHPAIPMLNPTGPASALPTSGANLSIIGSSGMAIGNSLPSPAPASASVRHTVPRAPVPLDEQQRMQQYNQILSNRKIQQSTLASPGTGTGLDRGLRMVPGGNNMGMGGVNRVAPLSRPGFQGMSSSAMLNSGNMLPSSTVGMPNTTSGHSGVGPGQGNTMMRPRENLNMARGIQGNNPVISPFSGLNSVFANQTVPPVQTYPGHLPQQHHVSPQQSHVLTSSHHPHIQGPNYPSGTQAQAFAIRQKQMHQRYIQQHQQQQLAASGPSVPHVQSQSQVSQQSSSQMQPSVSSQPLPLPPVTSSSTTSQMAQNSPQKPQSSPHGMGRNPQASGTGPTNQVGKQRQRQLHQQFQQSGRQHPQQRQPPSTQQQNRPMKGMGRGNANHQNLSVDPTHLNSLSVPPLNVEKRDPVLPVTQQCQPSHSTTSMSAEQTSKPLVSLQSSSHNQPQQKALPDVSTSSQQLQQMPLHSDNRIQGQVQANTVPVARQSVISPAAVASSHQHLQPQHVMPHQKRGNQMKQTAQRILLQNNQGNSEVQSKPQTNQTSNDHESADSPFRMTNTNTSENVNRGSVDVTSTRPAITPAVTAPLKASGPVYDSDVQNRSPKDACSTVPNTAENDVGPSSDSLPVHGYTVGAQTQNQQLAQQEPSSQPLSQKLCQLTEQQLLAVQSQHHHIPQDQKTRQIQAAQGNVSAMPSNAKVE